MLKILFNFIVCFIVLSSCSLNKIQRYSALKPSMDFENFFDGKLVGYGSTYDFFGRLDKRFIIKSEKVDNIDNDGKTIYHQSIEYIDTGKKEDMISYAIFDKNNRHKFIYKNDMMTDECVYEQYGNAANTNYGLNIKTKEGYKIVVSNDDWLYMIDKAHAISKIKVKKFGFTIGYVIINIEKKL